MNAKKVVVVGGGISGLALAYFLSEMGRQRNFPMEITLLEAKRRFGGIIETDHHQDFLLELGPDAFLYENPVLISLIGRLGLGDSLLRTQAPYRRSYILRAGKLRAVPEGFHLIAPTKLGPFLASDLLGWPGKLRLLMEPWVPPANGSNEESLAELIRRRFGREAYTWIGQPMLGGIYAGDPETLSADSALPWLRKMEQEEGSILRAFRRRDSRARDQAVAASGPRYGLFRSLRGGVETLVHRLVLNLSQVTLRQGVLVTDTEYSREGWRIVSEEGEVFPAGILCLALPARRAAELMARPAPEISKELRAIPHTSLASVHLAYPKNAMPRSLEGFGFVVPLAEKRPLIGCTFSSVKFPSAAPQDSVLLRAFVGGTLQPDLLELDDDTLGCAVADALQQILRIRSAPLFSRIHRLPEAMPQYTIGHRDRAARIEKELKRFEGLYLAGNAFYGVGIPECVAHAHRVAEAIACREPAAQACPS